MSPSRTATKRPTRTDIPFDQLTLDEKTFQLREPAADGVKAAQSKKASLDHVGNLSEVVKRGTKLDPITVWTNAQGEYVVVDGHHRFKAYRRAWKDTPKKKVPVFLLSEGTTEREARRLALKGNRKDTLTMTKRQKSQAAWTLICTDPSLRAMSSRKLDEHLGGIVSYGTLAKMQKAYKEHHETIREGDIPLWRSLQALNFGDGKFDAEEWEKRKIEKLAVDISGVLRKHGGNDPSIIEQAIEQALGDDLGYGVQIRIFAEGDDEDPDTEDDF